jgi:hypothetical protein
MRAARSTTTVNTVRLQDGYVIGFPPFRWDTPGTSASLRTGIKDMVTWSDPSRRGHIIGAQSHPTQADDQRRVQDHQRLHLGVFTQRPVALLNDLHRAVVLARQVVGVLIGEGIPRASGGLPDPRPLPGQRLWGPLHALLM